MDDLRCFNPYFRKDPYVFFGREKFLDHKNCGVPVFQKNSTSLSFSGRIQCRDLRRILAGRCLPACQPHHSGNLRCTKCPFFYGGSYIVWVFFWYKRIHWKVEFVAEKCWWLCLMIIFSSTRNNDSLNLRHIGHHVKNDGKIQVCSAWKCGNE